MDDVPISLYRTHGQMCTSKSYDEPESDTPKVFPFKSWKAGSITKITVSGHNGGACNDQLPNMTTSSFPDDSCCHDLSSSSSEGRTSSCRQRSRHPSGGIDPESHPACRALLGMGYSSGAVKKAAAQLRKRGQNLSADTLLDVIEETEAECENNTCSDTQECEDLLSRDANCASQSHPNDVTATWSDHSSCNLHSPAAVATGSLQDSPAPLTSDNNLGEEPDSSQHQKIVRDLRAENERLKQATICKICLDADIDTLFLPCRHLVCCRACADNVRDCPICREKILGTVRTFMA